MYGLDSTTELRRGVNGNKRIVLRVDNQSWYADLINNANRTGLVIVIVGVGETVRLSGEAVIESP